MVPIASLSLLVSQIPSPPEGGSPEEWITYIVGVAVSLWGADKAWWHLSRIKSKRAGEEVLPTVETSNMALGRLAEQQEKQSEVLSTMSMNQHHHIEATQSLARRLDELEHKTDKIWQQTISNSKDLEHLKDLQRLKGA